MGKGFKPRDVAAAQGIAVRGQRGVETAWGGDAAGAEGIQSSWHPLKQEIFGATQGISTPFLEREIRYWVTGIGGCDHPHPFRASALGFAIALGQGHPLVKGLGQLCQG
jgi:hypothetical protein